MVELSQYVPQWCGSPASLESYKKQLYIFREKSLIELENILIF